MALGRKSEQVIRKAVSHKWQFFRTGDHDHPRLVAAPDEQSLTVAEVVFKADSVKEYHAKVQEVEAFLRSAE